MSKQGYENDVADFCIGNLDINIYGWDIIAFRGKKMPNYGR